MRSLILIVVLIIALAACGPGPTDETLPTLAVLPTLTETVTPAATPGTAIAEAGPTALPSVTVSAVPPTGTVTEAPLTLTPSQTITDTITPTPSDTPTPTETLPALEGLSGLAFLAARATIQPDYLGPGTPQARSREEPVRRVTARPNVPPNAVAAAIPGTPTPLGGPVPVTCTTAAPPEFGPAGSDPTLNARLGCPVGSPPVAISAPSAYQPYERGFMLWVGGDGGGNIFAFRDDGTYTVHVDTWQEGIDPERGGEQPPSDGLAEPVRGFGKVWRENPAVRDDLGWATSGEAGGTAQTLQYDAGRLLAAPAAGGVYALSVTGTWRAYLGG